jgi:hypothetical protein
VGKWLRAKPYDQNAGCASTAHSLKVLWRMCVRACVRGGVREAPGSCIYLWGVVGENMDVMLYTLLMLVH